MKTIVSFFIALIISRALLAQNPVAKVNLPDVNQMMVYNGSYTEIFVDDPKRGGTFQLKAAPSLIDSGINFPSAKPGKAWVRVLTDQSLYVSWFGVKGDGVTNDYWRLRAISKYMNWIDTLPTERKIKNVYYENNRKYFVSMKYDGTNDLSFNNIRGVQFYGCGSTMIIDGNYTRTSNTDRMAKTAWVNCTNISINDFTVDHQNQLTIKNGKTENDQHGFALAGCENVLLKNCTALNAGTDGFYFYEFGSANPRSECRNITMINCASYYAARQGISVIQVYGLSVINCIFKYTGQHAAYSFAPQSGCDIEPNRYSNTGSITVRQNTGRLSFYNCTFSGNRGSQFVCGGTPRSYSDITVESCILNDIDSVDGNIPKGTGGIVIGLAGANCRFINNTVTIRYGFLSLGYSQQSTLYTTSVLLENNRFYFQDSVSDAWIRGNTNEFQELKIINNQFIGDSLCSVMTPNYTIMALTANFARKQFFIYDNNYVFIPKERWRNNGAGDYCNVTDLKDFTVRNSTWETDLTTTYKGATTAHYSVMFQRSLVSNCKFIGTNVGFAETIRPSGDGSNVNPNGVNSKNPYSIGNMLMADSLYFMSTSNLGKPNSMRYGTAIPTSGDYIIGDIVWNKSVTSGGTVGWICTASGNPGTWKSISSAAAVQTSTFSIVVGVVASLLILIFTLYSLPIVVPVLKQKLLDKQTGAGNKPPPIP